MTDSVQHVTLDQAIANALAGIHAQAWNGGGLYSQVLVTIDGVVNLDETNGYCTPIKAAGSGGQNTFLVPNTDDARLSQTDSEVASLQDAWDWIIHELPNHHPQPRGIWVVLVGNIGPCDSCKIRIANFRTMLKQRYPAPCVVAVEVVYDQANGSANPATRGNGIATTYGYNNLTPRQLPGPSVWRTVIT
jgi:hypothetical protein